MFSRPAQTALPSLTHCGLRVKDTAAFPQDIYSSVLCPFLLSLGEFLPNEKYKPPRYGSFTQLNAEHHRAVAVSKLANPLGRLYACFVFNHHSSSHTTKQLLFRNLFILSIAVLKRRLVEPEIAGVTFNLRDTEVQSSKGVCLLSQIKQSEVSRYWKNMQEKNKASP